jgi:quercetin dioxygenase-like cupin family protein
MSHSGDLHVPADPVILAPEAQQAVWFLSSLARIRIGGDATGGQLAVMEHQGERGHSSPLHRHDAADETFLVLEGELRVQVDGQTHTAGAGAIAFLPRRLPHAFAVTSAHARYLTLHTPAGFEEFTLEAGTLATTADAPPLGGQPPDLAAFAATARSYDIEILGPPPVL